MITYRGPGAARCPADARAAGAHVAQPGLARHVDELGGGPRPRAHPAAERQRAQRSHERARALDLEHRDLAVGSGRGRGGAQQLHARGAVDVVEDLQQRHGVVAVEIARARVAFHVADAIAESGRRHASASGRGRLRQVGDHHLHLRPAPAGGDREGARTAADVEQSTWSADGPEHGIGDHRVELDHGGLVAVPDVIVGRAVVQTRRISAAQHVLEPAQHLPVGRGQRADGHVQRHPSAGSERGAGPARRAPRGTAPLHVAHRPQRLQQDLESLLLAIGAPGQLRRRAGEGVEEADPGRADQRPRSHEPHPRVHVRPGVRRREPRHRVGGQPDALDGGGQRGSHATIRRSRPRCPARRRARADVPQAAA